MASHRAIVPQNAAASDSFGQHTPSRGNNPGKISPLGLTSFAMPRMTSTSVPLLVCLDWSGRRLSSSCWTTTETSRRAIEASACSVCDNTGRAARSGYALSPTPHGAIEIGQQAVLQTIDPVMDGDILPRLPGLLYRRRTSKALDLRSDRRFTQPVEVAVAPTFATFKATVGNVANWLQPLVDQAKALTADCLARKVRTRALQEPRPG